jgi:hypothetical protein
MDKVKDEEDGEMDKVKDEEKDDEDEMDRNKLREKIIE